MCSVNGLSIISELRYSSFSDSTSSERKDECKQADQCPESTLLTCHLGRYIASSLWPEFAVSQINGWVELNILKNTY